METFAVADVALATVTLFTVIPAPRSTCVTPWTKCVFCPAIPTARLD
jgi:hypothetical protein